MSERKAREGALLHVCQLTSTLACGGAEERIARLTQSLRGEGIHTSWIGFGELQRHLAELAGEGTRFIPVPRDPARGIEWTLVLEIAGILKALRPDVVHAHNWSTSLYGIGAAALAGVPVIYGDGGRDHPAPPSGRRQRAMRILAPHVDRFTAVCDYIRGELVRYWGASSAKVISIRSGVDVAAIEAGLAREAARSALGIDPERVAVAVIAGRFRPVKRLPDIIDAAGALMATGADFELLLIGDPGSEGAATLARARAAGLGERCRLLGHRPDLPQLLRGLDVVVNCSRYEGASNALLQAMAAGVPVLGTEVGGTPELIEDGVSGLVVPPEDVPRLARALSRLVEDRDLRAVLGRGGRARVLARHGHAAMVEAHERLYREVAAERRQHAPLGRLATGFWRSLDVDSARPDARG